MRLAAQWGHYTFEEFVELDGDEQAAVIAAFRIYHYMDGLQAHLANAKTKKK